MKNKDALNIKRKKITFSTSVESVLGNAYKSTLNIPGNKTIGDFLTSAGYKSLADMLR